MDQEALEAIRQMAAQVQALTIRMEAIASQQQATNAQQKAMLNREAEQASTIRNLQESHKNPRAEAREAVNATAQRLSLIHI